MKFQLIVLGFGFNFLHIPANFNIRNNTMKKMLLATAVIPAQIQDVLNRRLLFKTNRQQ